MKFGFALATALALSPFAAMAQGLVQGGAITPGHLGRWVASGVIGDGGGAGGCQTQGNCTTELGITNTGTPFGIFDVPIQAQGGYHSLTLGANALGGGLLNYQNNAGAQPLPFQICVNGQCQTFPFGSSGPPVAVGIPPEQCGAIGNGVTDDSQALIRCDATAQTNLTSLLLTKTYRTIGTVTLGAPDLFVPDSSLKPDAGATIVLNGAVSAPDTSIIFTGLGTVTTPDTPRVSVAWWGAVPEAADSVPGFVASIGSNRTIVCPPGTYFFNSVKQTRPLTTLNFTSVYITGQTNFEYSCEGANIVPGSQLLASVNTASGGAGGAYGLFQIDGNSTDFKVHGFQFNGDYHSTAIQNTAFAMFGTQRSSFYNLDFSGNWGGIADPFVGDWQTDAVFHDIKMPNVGICFDFGYNHHIAFDKIFAHGSNGSGGPGAKCFSVITDTPNNGTNPTPVPITDTLGYSVSNSDISNFALQTGYGPVVLAAGRNYRFHGNYWHDNPGSSVGLGVAPLASVATIFYVNGGVFSSVGTPVNDVIFDGDVFDSNGSAQGLPVIQVAANNITNSDTIGGIVVANCTFTRNNVATFAALSNPGITGMANPAYSGGNNYFDDQTLLHEVDPVTMLLGLIPGHRQTVSGNSGAYAGAGQTSYMWTTPSNTNENLVKAQGSAYVGFARNLTIFSSSPGVGQSVSFTFRVDGVSTGLACTVSGTANRCFDTDPTHLIGLNNLSGVDIQITSSAGAAAGSVFWGIELDSQD